MAYSFEKQPASRFVTTTNFTVATSAQTTAAVGSQTYHVRVSTNSAVTTVFVKVGDGAVAATTASDAIMGANQIDYFTCTPGQKVSVIGGTAAGIVSISEMS